MGNKLRFLWASSVLTLALGIMVPLGILTLVHGALSCNTGEVGVVDSSDCSASETSVVAETVKIKPGFPNIETATFLDELGIGLSASATFAESAGKVLGLPKTESATVGEQALGGDTLARDDTAKIKDAGIPGYPQIETPKVGEATLKEATFPRAETATAAEAFVPGFPRFETAKVVETGRGATHLFRAETAGPTDLALSATSFPRRDTLGADEDSLLGLGFPVVFAINETSRGATFLPRVATGTFIADLTKYGFPRGEAMAIKLPIGFGLPSPEDTVLNVSVLFGLPSSEAGAMDAVGGVNIPEAADALFVEGADKLGPQDQFASSIVIDEASILGDGIDRTDVTFTLLDSQDQAMVGKEIEFTTDDGVVFPKIVETDSEGVAKATLISAPGLLTPGNPVFGRPVTGTQFTLQDSVAYRRDSFEVELFPGWNLISLPLIPVDPVTGLRDVGIEDVLGVLNDPEVIDSVWWYDPFPAEVWKVFTPGPAADDLLTLEDGRGYWVRLVDDAEATTLPIEGFTILFQGGFPGPPPDYPVSKGWNLIGLKTTKNSKGDLRSISPKDYLRSLGDNWSGLWEFRNQEDGGYRRVKDPAGGTEGGQKTMDPGLGFWLFVTEGGLSIAP